MDANTRRLEDSLGEFSDSFTETNTNIDRMVEAVDHLETSIGELRDSRAAFAAEMEQAAAALNPEEDTRDLIAPEPAVPPAAADD